jgi:hypothetical protein
MAMQYPKFLFPGRQKHPAPDLAAVLGVFRLFLDKTLEHDWPQILNDNDYQQDIERKFSCQPTN